MFKKVLLSVLLMLFAVSFGYSGEEIISQGLISTDDFAPPGDAVFDRAHMCSQTVSDADCAIPETYTLEQEQPKFHLLFWAPNSQNYNRHYLVTDSAGTLVSYELFSGFLASDWHTLTYVPDAFIPVGDYNFYVIFQGTGNGKAAVKSYFFAVR